MNWNGLCDSADLGVEGLLQNIIDVKRPDTDPGHFQYDILPLGFGVCKAIAQIVAKASRVLALRLGEGYFEVLTLIGIKVEIEVCANISREPFS